MKNARQPAFSALLAAVLSGLLMGCITDSLSGLNPFNRGDPPIPGERVPVLQTAAATGSGGTASVGPASPSADWSQPGGNAANAPGHVALAGSGGSAAFRSRVIAGQRKKSERTGAPPLIYNGQFFVYDASGTVTALSGGGARLWSVSLKPEKERSRAPGGGIAASGEAVFAATGYGDVVALGIANGGRIWSYELRAPARSAPTAAGGKVYVVTVTNVLHAINIADGTAAWTFPGIPETAGVLSGASPAVAGDTVVVPYSSGEVIAFDAATGELKWADAVVRSARTRAVSGLTDVAASPVVHDGIVYASGISGRTIAVKLSGGERVWEQNIGSSATPAVSGNSIFVVDLDDNMVALNLSDGSVIWRTALPVVRKRRFRSVWTGPTLAGNALWAVSSDGRIIAVEPATGQIVGDRKLDRPAYMKPVAASGRLLVLAGDGSLTAYQ